MLCYSDTIFALSSGQTPSAVAVVRVSGPASSFILDSLAGPIPPWSARLRPLRNSDGSIIDHGLVLWFPAPRSFTGDDMAEFQIHGGNAVVTAVFMRITELGGRIAEPGEFTRRAFANGKLDLTQVEGLADLIAAETEVQRRQALDMSAGRLRTVVADWREQLLRLRSTLEARLDFSDEADVAEDLPASYYDVLKSLSESIRGILSEARRGEIVRNGYRVSILGPPNAGKSSLLNALAGREAAIVTSEPGTTRDVIEVRVELAGYVVRISDTAGLREADSAAEKEGIRRATLAASASDLIIWAAEAHAPVEPPVFSAEVVRVATKTDCCEQKDAGAIGISVVSGSGLSELRSRIVENAKNATGVSPALIARERQRHALQAVLSALDNGAAERDEFAADSLRHAGDALARIGGGFDVEAVLDRLFSEFCIGK